jgi:hypothetical protein
MEMFMMAIGNKIKRRAMAFILIKMAQNTKDSGLKTISTATE